MCWPIGGAGVVACVIEGATSAAGGIGMNGLAESISEGVGTTITSLGTAWTLVPSPILLTDSGQTGETVSFVSDALWLVTGGLLLMSFIVGFVRMSLEQRADPLRKLSHTVLTYIVVSAGGLTFLSLLTLAMDSLAMSVLNASMSGTDFGANMLVLLGFAGTNGLGVLLMIVLGGVAILVSLGQVAMFLARWAITPLVAGVWPTSAAFTMTAAGETWFKRMTTWLAALVFYKLAAAIVYGTAFRLAGSDVLAKDGSGIMSLVAGLVLMILALLALPALVKVISPVVAASGGGGGGGLMAGALAGAASGAINAGMLSRGGGSSNGGSGNDGSSGPAGDPGPTGSVPADTAGGGRPTGAGGSDSQSPDDTSGPAPSTEMPPGGSPATGPGPVGAGAGASTGGAAAGGGAAGAGSAAAGSGAAGAGAATAGPAAPAVVAAGAVKDGVQAAGRAAQGAAEAAASTPEGAGHGDGR